MSDHSWDFVGHEQNNFDQPMSDDWLLFAALPSNWESKLELLVSLGPSVPRGLWLTNFSFDTMKKLDVLLPLPSLHQLMRNLFTRGNLPALGPPTKTSIWSPTHWPLGQHFHRKSTPFITKNVTPCYSQLLPCKSHAIMELPVTDQIQIPGKN